MNPTPRRKNSTSLISITLAPTSTLDLRTASVISVNPLSPHLHGIDVDLVLFDVPTDRGDFGHALDRVELVPDVPVLDASQLGEIEALAFDRVPEDLAQRGGVRTQHGLDARGRCVSATASRSRTRVREVVDVLVENHEDHREPESRHDRTGLHAGGPRQVTDQRISDLIVDVLRARPGQSATTITCVSPMSGIASTGMWRSEYQPQPIRVTAATTPGTGSSDTNG